MEPRYDHEQFGSSAHAFHKYNHYTSIIVFLLYHSYYYLYLFCLLTCFVSSLPLLGWKFHKGRNLICLVLRFSINICGINQWMIKLFLPICIWIKHTFKKYFPTYYFISSSEKFPYDGQHLILASLCERDPMIPNYLPN